MRVKVSTLEKINFTLAIILQIVMCFALSSAVNGQAGGSGGGNPPFELRRGASRTQIDVGGNFYVDLATGRVIRWKSTCTGATVSAATEAKLCFDTTAAALRLSVNGGAYSPILTTATAPAAVTPGGINTQVQFNDSSAFGGDAGFTYNKTTDTATLANLTVTGTCTGCGGSVGGETLLQTFTVNLNDASAQIVYTVSVGKSAFPTRALLRSFSVQPDDGNTASVALGAPGVTLNTFNLAGMNSTVFVNYWNRASGSGRRLAAGETVTITPNAAYGSAATAVIELYGIEY